MPQDPRLDRVPEGMMLSQEEWAFFSEASRRFLVALAARYKEMERLLAERDAGEARQAAPSPSRAEATGEGR